VDGPRRHRLRQNEVVADLKQRGPSVEQISRIGVNAVENVVLHKKLWREASRSVQHCRHRRQTARGERKRERLSAADRCLRRKSCGKEALMSRLEEKFMLASMAILVAASAGAETWRTYHNTRFGTTAEVPASWKMGPPPENNDGRAFSSPDGRAAIIISGIFSVLSDKGGSRNSSRAGRGRDHYL
jgi:hypothetical protein